MAHQILLYYKYVHIDDPEAFAEVERKLCTELGLKGRILIAHEGINGTVEGTVETTETYVQELMKDERFSDIHIKRSVGTGVAFKKMFVRVRNEIVGTHFDADINPTMGTSPYISAEELHTLIRSGEKIKIVDMRNDYEFKIGQFENSILPSLSNSRDLLEKIKELEPLKNERIITVCTGGVRCEKMSALLLKHGFTHVSQLHGGIVTYMEKYPNKDFKGKLYVFDDRISIGFQTESTEHEIIANCERCSAVSDNYINCNDTACHKQFICCASCVEAGHLLCPAGCIKKIRAHNH